MITNLAQHLRERVFAFRVESILLHHFFFLLLSCLFFPFLFSFAGSLIVCFLRCIFVFVFDFEKEKGFVDHHLVIKRKAIVCFLSLFPIPIFFFLNKKNKGLTTRCREIELYLNEETVLYDITLG
jgi:hypothetical protein